jgi:hypothetical protein
MSTQPTMFTSNYWNYIGYPPYAKPAVSKRYNKVPNSACKDPPRCLIIGTDIKRG